MLDEKQLIQEAVETNLFYLRTLKEFCLNVQTSFLVKEQNLADEMEKIAKACEMLMVKILTQFPESVSQRSIDYQIFVTPFTLKCEELTEKLFAVLINKELTRQELSLKSGTPAVSEEKITEIQTINQEAYRLAENFIEDGKVIFENLLKNQLFSYSYPTMFAFMLYEIGIYQGELKRLLESTKQSPSTALSYELDLNIAMKTIATFIEKLVDPKNIEISQAARNFIIKFQERENIYKSTPLSPDIQKKLSDEEYTLVQEFQQFLENCIQQVLNEKAYFIIEPIFLDNMLTEVNYFLFKLSSRPETQSTT